MTLTLQLQTREGLKVATINLSARDQQMSIEGFCRLYLEPALAKLGWKAKAAL